MAFRIHDSVVRGEIDNRAKGVVRGKVWVEGRAEPVVLELRGNAHPDLAGCLLAFVNPLARQKHPHLDSLHSLQTGTIGDLTASRKVRVFDVPLEEALSMVRRQEKPPEHMANSLYLEWFSEANGRVVIESADYQLTISAPEWRLTPEENQQRARDAASGMAGFMGRLTEAIERQQRGQKDPDEEWNEFDYEKFLKESDARTDKYLELLDKYGDSDDAEIIIAREMGWDRELPAEDTEDRRVEEIDAACGAAFDEAEPEPDPQLEGIDWIRTDDGDLRHPLQHRCFESAVSFWDRLEKLGPETNRDPDVVQFLSEFQISGAKLAGALTGLTEGRGTRDGAFTVAYLKRALDHLHKSQAGLEAVVARAFLPETMVVEARKELLEIRQGILNLMDRFRGTTGSDSQGGAPV